MLVDEKERSENLNYIVFIYYMFCIFCVYIYIFYVLYCYFLIFWKRIFYFLINLFDYDFIFLNVFIVIRF